MSFARKPLLFESIGVAKRESDDGGCLGCRTLARLPELCVCPMVGRLCSSTYISSRLCSWSDWKRQCGSAGFGSEVVANAYKSKPLTLVGLVYRCRCAVKRPSCDVFHGCCPINQDARNPNVLPIHCRVVFHRMRNPRRCTNTHPSYLYPIVIRRRQRRVFWLT